MYSSRLQSRNPKRRPGRPPFGLCLQPAPSGGFTLGARMVYHGAMEQKRGSFQPPAFSGLERLPGALLPWYQQNARALPWRADREPYHVWLSEIMLQQTRVEAVRGYYLRFLEALPTIAALAEAEEGALLKLWEGLGYYSRARNLQRAAQRIQKEFDGVFPREYKAIRSLPGIGDYTAGAIGSICFEMPVAAVDGNVLRVIARLCHIRQPMDPPPMKRAVAAALEAVYPPGQCGDFTQALMELGATLCPPGGKPRCDACPCRELCQGRMAGAPEALPLRTPKRPRKQEAHTLFLLRWEGRIAIRRRPGQGLLAGMWEFPNVPGRLSTQEALEQAAAWGLSPIGPEQVLHRTHIFTHLEWDMTGYVIPCAEGAPAFCWALPQELTGVYALPTAFRQFLPALEQ